MPVQYDNETRVVEINAQMSLQENPASFKNQYIIHKSMCGGTGIIAAQ